MILRQEKINKQKAKEQKPLSQRANNTTKEETNYNTAMQANNTKKDRKNKRAPQTENTINTKEEPGDGRHQAQQHS